MQHPHAIALFHQLGYGAAAADFEVVRVGCREYYVELLVAHLWFSWAQVVAMVRQL
jgi:hypothetical protein